MRRASRWWRGRVSAKSRTDCRAEAKTTTRECSYSRRTKTPRGRGSARAGCRAELRRDGADFGGVDVDEAAVLAAVLIADHAGDLGEQGVVLDRKSAGRERG